MSSSKTGTPRGHSHIGSYKGCAARMGAQNLQMGVNFRLKILRMGHNLNT